MRRVLSLLAGLVLFVASSTAANAAKATLTIEGMTCGGCVAAVKLQLRHTEGVTAYEVSYEDKRAEVTYDPARTNPQKIADSVAQTGYRVAVAGAAPAPKGAVAAQMPAVGPDALRDWFNKNAGSVRVVSILSPTCPDCRSGHGVLKSVFEKSNSPDLEAFLIWLPMKAADDAKEASLQASTFRDSRLTEGWDQGRAVGDLFARRLSLRGAAWDVYLVYDRGVRWHAAEPPQPSFWMHQLQEKAGADQKLCLNPTRFTNEVVARLERRH